MYKKNTKIGGKIKIKIIGKFVFKKKTHFFFFLLKTTILHIFYLLLDFYFIYVNILNMESVKPKGRPKKNDAKRERVIIACSLADKQKIESAALNAGSSVSGFILNCIKQFIY